MKTSPLYSLLFMSLFFLFSACQKDEILLSTPSEFSLRELTVGQKIKYQEIRVDFLRDTTTAPLSKDCYYGEKSLTLEVMEKTKDGFIVKEYLSDQTADEVGTQLISINGDQIDVEQLDESATYIDGLFHQKSFSITPVIAPAATLEEDCFYPDLTNLPAGGPPGYAIHKSKINGSDYQNLYAYRFDGAMAVDGPGYTYLFSRNAALIRSITYGGFFPFLKGWELINP